MSFFKSLFGGNQTSQQNDQGQLENYFKELQKEVTNDLEQLYVDSLKDIKKAKPFFDLFKVTDFYFAGSIEGDVEKNEDGSVRSTENTKLSFNMFPIQGKPMCPFFTSKQKMQESLGKTAAPNYIQFKFKDFFHSKSKDTFIMNPGFVMVKVFPPETIRGILDDSLIKSMAPPIEKGTKLQIGIPKEVPEEFFKELVLYASKQEAIKEIYYALLIDSQHGQRIALAIKFDDVAEGTSVYFGDIQELVEKNDVGYGGFVDMAELKDSNQLAQGIKKAGERLY